MPRVGLGWKSWGSKRRYDRRHLERPFQVGDRIPTNAPRVYNRLCRDITARSEKCRPFTTSSLNSRLRCQVTYRQAQDRPASPKRQDALLPSILRTTSVFQALITPSGFDLLVSLSIGPFPGTESDIESCPGKHNYTNSDPAHVCPTDVVFLGWRSTVPPKRYSYSIFL